MSRLKLDKDFKIDSCPICLNEEDENSSILGTSSSFNKEWITCSICSHTSIRDLSHGIVSGQSEFASHIPCAPFKARSGPTREGVYSGIINKMSNIPKSVLEIGPGNYRLAESISKLQKNRNKKIDITVIDVGRPKKSKLWTSISIDRPSTSNDILNLSLGFYNTIARKNKKFELGVALHSFEHSADPVTLFKIFEDFCEDFIVEIPNGERSKNTGDVIELSPPARVKSCHYSLFSMDSLKYLASNILSQDREYYIGYSKHIKKHYRSICISTQDNFLNAKHKLIFKKTGEINEN